MRKRREKGEKKRKKKEKGKKKQKINVLHFKRAFPHKIDFLNIKLC